MEQKRLATECFPGFCDSRNSAPLTKRYNPQYPCDGGKFKQIPKAVKLHQVRIIDSCRKDKGFYFAIERRDHRFLRWSCDVAVACRIHLPLAAGQRLRLKPMRCWIPGGFDYLVAGNFPGGGNEGRL